MSNALGGSNVTNLLSAPSSYNNLFSANPAVAVIAAAAAQENNAPQLPDLAANSFTSNRNSTGSGIFPSTSQLTSFKGLAQNPLFFQSRNVKSPADEYVFITIFKNKHKLFIKIFFIN